MKLAMHGADAPGGADRSSGLKRIARSGSLRERAEQLALVLDESGYATWIWDIRKDRVQWYGSPRTLLGRNFSGRFSDYLSAVHHEDRGIALRIFTECLKGLRPQYRSEERVIWPDSSVHWLETYGRGSYGPAGRCVRMVGVVRDITERKKQETALATSEARFSKAFRSAPTPLTITREADGIFVEVNQGFERVSGWSAQEVIGRNAMDLHMWSEPKESAAVIATMARDGSVRDFLVHLRRKDGSERTCEMTSERIEIGGEHFIIAQTRELTDIVRAREQQQASEQKYLAVFNSALDGIVIVSASGILLDVNPTGCLATGYLHEELAGRHFSALLDAGLPALRPLDPEDIYVTGSARIEHKIRRKDGSLFIAEIRAGPLPDGNFHAIMRDVSERKRAEEALREGSARLEARTRRLLEVQESERRAVARELHDEVGGALTAVKLNLQSLRGKWSGDPGEAALADCLALVDGAIQAVRSRSLDLRPAVLDDLGLIPALKWYCEHQTQRAGVAIELALEAIDLKLAPPLESGCFRIVQESVTNALRHANARGIKISLRRGDGVLVLEIADDGNGFDAVAARQRALAGESSGVLGMEERAKLLSGLLTIDSAPGAGTRVRAEFAAPEGGFA